MSAAGHTLAVIAKAPVAGRSKTRLCPPCTPAQAAAIAEAALRQTLDDMARTPCGRRVVVLDGEPGPWLPEGFDVLPQRGTGLAERLAAAFADVGGSTFILGMDTPQAGPERLHRALRALDTHDAAIGGARDGGYWGIGLTRPDPAVFRGVPMSEAGTGARQRTRLVGLGLRVAELDVLRDVDHFADALAVAAMIPGGPFAAAVAAAASEHHALAEPA